MLATEGDPLASELVGLATELGVRIAVAESLTGGLLSATLVAVPGVSLVFSGGIVAYDTALKTSLLGVDRTLLRERGPVDPEVARQMARGAREACATPAGSGGSSIADIGIATTGVAGPDPDPQTGQPPGTVWLGVSSSRGERAVRLEDVRLGGVRLDDGLLSDARLASATRFEIRAATVRGALALLLEELRAEDPPRNTV